MILVLTTEWYTYTPPPGWPAGTPVPFERRIHHLAGRAVSTLCFDEWNGDGTRARIKGCGAVLTQIAVADRYRREGRADELGGPTGHRVHAKYQARFRLPGEGINRTGGADL